MGIAIITGASRGIGCAAAKLFATEGYDLIINCRSSFAQLDAVAAQLSEQVCCVPVHGRIDETSLEAALDSLALLRAERREKVQAQLCKNQNQNAENTACMENPSKCTSGMQMASNFERTGASSAETQETLCLINNGGISRLGLLQDVSDAEWEEMLDANLTSMFRAVRAVIPHMLKRQGGRIINVSSVWGDVGASCEVAYSATKGAINAFTRALAKELAPSRIAVNAIAFGAVDTDMNAWLSEEEREALAEEIPYGRMASPEEAAQFIKTLVQSPDYLSGQVIRFDGAWI